MNENIETILMRQYIELIWEKNWRRAKKFARDNLSLFYTLEKMSFTVKDMKNLLIAVEEMIGFRMDDSFESDDAKRDFVFKSENLKYEYYLRCRRIHIAIHIEFYEYLNPNMELDPNMEMDVRRDPTLFLQSILQFPKIKIRDLKINQVS